MCPIAGSSPGHHVIVERIINAHGDRVGTSPAEQMSDIKHERRVTFPHMLSGQFPVYPDCGCMEYGLKFDPNRGVLPFTRSIESSPIPGDPSVVTESGFNLPSMRHMHFSPRNDGLIASVPTLLLTNISRISPKPPLAAQAYSLRCGEVRCFLTCRESRCAQCARSQDADLSQEFSTRMHGKAPFPIMATWQLTRYS